MERKYHLTEGNILATLTGFAIPVFFTLFLQALYGGIDLLIVGKFADTEDVSGVATGSMLLSTVTMIITGLAMGITVLVGEKIGMKKPDEAGKAIGAGISLFFVFAVILTFAMTAGSDFLAKILNAPEEAVSQTSSYIFICGAGSAFIVAYNILGAIFRGIGDSKTPLMTVAIACTVNIAGDMVLVAVFDMGTIGAAIATVFAQAVSVFISFVVIVKRGNMPFFFSKEFIKFDKKIIGTELKLGIPVALQELLVGISFLVIQTIVNSFGVTASAGVGVAEKVCAFIMLVPSSYMQSMSAFVAQNMGARNPVRAKKALKYGIMTAFAAGLIMSYIAFFHGDMLSWIFSKDIQVIAASQSYLKAYAIDCLLTPFLFCFTGYYNGCEKTLFVMLQGLVGAFFVRIPAAYFISRISETTLFHIGLATPASSILQITLCIFMFAYTEKKSRSEKAL